MAITTLPTGLKYPAHGEAANTWDDDINQGFIDHDAHQAHWIRSVPFREVHVNVTYGSDANPSDAIGRPDYPYQTLAAAVAAIPNGGNIGQATGTKIILQGSNAVTSGNPTAKYPTGGATITLPAYCWLVGAGADADRSRASCLIEDTVSGPLLLIGSRYVKIENIGVRNLSTAVGSCGIQTDTTSGGMQNFELSRVHVYGCRQGVILKTFNVDCSRIIQCQFSNNRLEGLILTSAGTDAPNQLLIKSTDINQNNTDVVAGTSNVSLIADNGGSTNAHFDMCKIHGFSRRFDVQGWHNLWITRCYFEVGTSGYGGLYDDASMIRVTSNPNGSTADEWAYGVYVVGNRFHSPHGGVPANWTSGVPVIGDVDRCHGYHFDNNLVDDNIDLDSTNPGHRVGADVRDWTHRGNVYIDSVAGSYVEITDPSALYSKNASQPPYNGNGDYLGDIW